MMVLEYLMNGDLHTFLNSLNKYVKSARRGQNNILYSKNTVQLNRIFSHQNLQLK